MFKKILAAGIVAFGLISCGGAKNKTLTIGVSPVPHKEIVELVKDDLKKEGIDLKVVVFNDYVQPNTSLKDKSLDCNFFQHVPYMEQFNKEYNMDMVSVGKVHLEPMKIYSDKITDIKDVPNGGKVLIPNDPTNRGRALLLLQSAGLITLKDSSKLDSSVDDIKDNPKNLEITGIVADQIPPRLGEVDIAVINTNIALAANISKDKAIYTEGSDSPYVNVVVTLKENENDPRIKKLVKALQSEKVKKFINEKYNGEVVPAF